MLIECCLGHGDKVKSFGVWSDVLHCFPHLKVLFRFLLVLLGLIGFRGFCWLI